jgi:hypothetical protein
VPWSVRKVSGSKCSCGPGVTASSTRGSARAARARETPCQMLSRVLGSASIIAPRESSHPIAAFGWFELRIATASDAALGSRVHRNSSAGGGRRARRRGAGLERGAGLAFPEPAGLDPAGGQAGGGGEAVGADHRGQRVLAAAHGRPAQPGGDAFGEVLRVEHRDRPALAASGAEGRGEVVGPGAGGDDRAGCVEDRVDDDMQAFAGAGWADQQDRVLDRCPDLRAATGPEQVADILRCWRFQGGPQRGRAVQQCLRGCCGLDFVAGRDPGEAVRVGLGLPGVAAQHDPHPDDPGGESAEQCRADEPVDDRVEPVGTERGRGVGGVEQHGEPRRCAGVGWGVPVRNAATLPAARRTSAIPNMPIRPMRAALVSSSPMPPACRWFMSAAAPRACPRCARTGSPRVCRRVGRRGR